MRGKLGKRIIVKYKHLVGINKILYKISRGRICLHPIVEIWEAPSVSYEFCHICGLNMRYAYLTLKIALLILILVLFIAISLII